MVMYEIFYTTQAMKQIKNYLKNSPLKDKTKKLIEIIKVNPYQTPPPYEKLFFGSQKCYSRRINVQHRLVYEVFEEQRSIKILSVWTHYEF